MLHIPFRWDLTNRNHLGSLVEGEKAVSYPRLLRFHALSRRAGDPAGTSESYICDAQDISPGTKNSSK